MAAIPIKKENSQKQLHISFSSPSPGPARCLNPCHCQPTRSNSVKTTLTLLASQNHERSCQPTAPGNLQMWPSRQPITTSWCSFGPTGLSLINSLLPAQIVLIHQKAKSHKSGRLIYSLAASFPAEMPISLCTKCMCALFVLSSQANPLQDRAA